MISIIIASINSTLLQQVSANIDETIGVPYEIIPINNSKSKQGICAVYNQGIIKAKYDVLCFMHEDIVMQTQNWGLKLVDIFNNNPDVGLVGVYGSIYKPFTPSGWEGTGMGNIYANIIQSYKFSAREPSYYKYPYNSLLEQVACVDGVWLATTRKIAREIGFDEAVFTGFHCYDHDYSIAVGQKHKVMVTYEILINHLSEGHYDGSWLNDTLKLHEKWHDVLPVDVKGLSLTERAYIEKSVFKELIKKLAGFKFSLKIAGNLLKCDARYKQLNLYWKLKFYICKTYLKHRK